MLGQKKIKSNKPANHEYIEAYNRGIDDLVNYANTMPTIENEDGEIRPMWLEEMAKRLKVGEKNAM